MSSFIEQTRRNYPSIFWVIALSLGLSMVGLILDIIQKPLPDTYGLGEYLMLPSHLTEAIKQPWAILTYAFITPIEGRLLLGFLLNMLFIYQFGRILHSFIGEKKVRNLIMFALQFNALITLIVCSVIPGAAKGDQFLWGLSGLTVTLIAATVTLSPKYPINLMLFGRVAIIWVGIVLIAFKFLSYQSFRSFPEVISLLSGILLGFAHIKLMKQGTDIPGTIFDFFESVARRQPKSKMKVVYRKSEEKLEANEETINLILDKISKVGYQKLTKAEKELLANYSGEGKEK